MPQLSTAVLAAQAQLQQRRQQWRTAQQHSPTGTLSDPQTAVSLPEKLNQLPPHLGWGSVALTAVLRPAAPTPQAPFPLPEPTLTAQPPVSHTPTLAVKVRHYPALGTAALQQNRVPHYQVWLACRLLDADGRGWLDAVALRQQLSGQQTAVRLFGWRRLRQVLTQGNGRFWEWDKANGRLWLFGAARVGQALRVARLAGQPVWLPLTALTTGIGHFKAHLYAAWHSGRQNGKPVSRATLRQLTAVPERTQRLYEKQTGTSATFNFAVGAPYNAPNIEKMAWQQGKAIFQFTDKNGRFGKKNGRYIAWQMPNSYSGPHAPAARGQQRQINHQLADLVHKRAQGNDQPAIEPRYFAHGAAAAQALAKQKTAIAYWPQRQGTHSHLWAHFNNE